MLNYKSASDMAELWGVSSQLVRKYCRQGRIPLAVQGPDGWIIPEGTEKPGKKIEEKEPDYSKLVKKLLYQKERNNHFGIYEYLQVNAAYSSSRMASNRLTRTQVEEIYRTNRITSSFESVKVDDIIEILNHFQTMRYILDTVNTPLSRRYIKEVHRQLAQGTYSDRLQNILLGMYRTKPVKINKETLLAPTRIDKELKELIDEYEKKKITLEQIVSFHVKLEKIHPFDDYNGRVGRLIMIKECLRFNIDPFIIDDKKRSEYNKGISLWGKDKSLLMGAVLKSQERFESNMEICRLMQYNRQL